ncbi:8912_t:CDS:10 [Diversispora eburnea]|uniref:Sorting nexin-4 n=1 Tax=Diversispora eburnea TaxID=1213867 RepID=A0A9N8VUX3_9GLOM|nr:8912_t:CDS:10 [Diversispora eburnea]
MNFIGEDYDNVTWDTRATSSLQPEDLSDDENTDGATESNNEDSTFSNVDDAMFSTLATSSLIYPAADPMKTNQPPDSYLSNVVVPVLFPMKITVTEPQKQLDGTKDAFISYLITTKTTLDTFLEPTAKVRRRFQDFVLLYNSLSRDFAACVIPPLPDKHRMEYITGDRFGPEFVEKRRASLQRFLERIARHPTLQKSEYFRIFLESRDWASYILLNGQYKQKKAGDGVFENLGDALLNAFSKLKKPDERFVEMKESVEKLEENLQAVERLYQKIIKRQTDLEADYREFGSSVTGMGQLETEITAPLQQFGDTVSKFADAWKQMTDREEHGFLNQIHDYLTYCHCVKNVLKLRDQKQVDFEELSEYLQNALNEKANLVNTGKASTGISSYLREKVDNIKGIDQEQAKKEKIQKLDTKILELQKEVESSNDVANKFSSEVAKEFEVFQTGKTIEMKDYLLLYADSHVEFYRQSIELWEEIIPILENIKFHA